METLGRRIARLRSGMASEEGFTLVEVMVAIAVLLIAITVLVRTATVAFRDVGTARQRQTANQLANQLIEEVRALPSATIQRGLKTNQLSGDPNVVSCSGTYYFPVCPPATRAEKVVHTNGGPNTRPLIPHQGTVQPSGSTTYVWSVYVTEAVAASTAGVYRVTALISWAPPHRLGVRNAVDVQTLFYFPTGSVDTTTHPFTGPRQAYYFGSANAGAGTVSAVGTAEGIDFEELSADLLQTTSTAQTEQSIRVEGATYLPSLTRRVGGVETTAGSSDSSQADTDPVTTPGVYDSKLIGPQPFGSQFVGGATTSLQSWTDGADQGQTISATAAGGANACNSQIDGLPCGYGTGTMPDGANESPYGDYDTSIFAVANNLGAANLLGVGSSTTPTTTYVRRTGAGPSGLVRGTVGWTLPEIRLGGVLSAMDPPHNNWEGYWVRLTGFTATATAESGPGSAAPSLSVAGQIRYWRNNQYQTFTVNQSGGAVNISNVSYRDNSVGPNSDRVDVDISGTITVERSSTTRAVNAGVTTEATANVASPMVAQFTYRIVRNDVTELDITVAFNAGRARVSTSYKPVAT